MKEKATPAPPTPESAALNFKLAQLEEKKRALEGCNAHQHAAQGHSVREATLRVDAQIREITAALNPS